MSFRPARLLVVARSALEAHHGEELPSLPLDLVVLLPVHLAVELPWIRKDTGRFARLARDIIATVRGSVRPQASVSAIRVRIRRTHGGGGHPCERRGLLQLLLAELLAQRDAAGSFGRDDEGEDGKRAQNSTCLPAVAGIPALSQCRPCVGSPPACPLPGPRVQARTRRGPWVAWTRASPSEAPCRPSWRRSAERRITEKESDWRTQKSLVFLDPTPIGTPRSAALYSCIYSCTPK